MSFSFNTRAFRAVAYSVAALAFARPGRIADFGWPGRFYFGPSLLLGWWWAGRWVVSTTP